LISNEQDSLETEFVIAQVKQVFQARAKQINHHGVVTAFQTKQSHKAIIGLHGWKRRQQV
jgi:hypothetical protein